MKSSFPTFLDATFDRLALEQRESSIAVLAPAGTILWVNPSWQRNASPEGLVPSFEGGVDIYYEGVAPRLRDFYASVFGRALEMGQVFDQIYGSSSPTTRRVVHCRVQPIDRKGLVVEHSRVVDIDAGGLTEEAWTRKYVVAGGVPLQCSYCRRVRGPTSHAWDWMSPWAARSAARSSHVICPLCERQFWGKRLP